MRWFKKTKQQDHEDLTPFEIPGINGSAGVTFPGIVVDRMRQLITRSAKNEDLPAVLSIVSALRGEGVTYIAHALAATIAHDSMKTVCVVDLNWWWPSTSPLIPEQNPGLAAVMVGDVPLDEVIVSSGWANLYLIPAGKLPREQRAVIARSQFLKELIEDLRASYDHLILDVPAILATNDSIPLASLGDACGLVVRQGVTSVEDVKLALDEITHLKILGGIMNQVKLETPPGIVKLVAAR